MGPDGQNRNASVLAWQASSPGSTILSGLDGCPYTFGQSSAGVSMSPAFRLLRRHASPGVFYRLNEVNQKSSETVIDGCASVRSP